MYNNILLENRFHLGSYRGYHNGVTATVVLCYPNQDGLRLPATAEHRAVRIPCERLVLNIPAAGQQRRLISPCTRDEHT